MVCGSIPSLSPDLQLPVDESSTLPFVVAHAVWLLPTFFCSLGISFWTQKQMSDSRSQVLW